MEQGGTVPVVGCLLLGRGRQDDLPLDGNKVLALTSVFLRQLGKGSYACPESDSLTTSDWGKPHALGFFLSGGFPPSREEAGATLAFSLLYLSIHPSTFQSSRAWSDRSRRGRDKHSDIISTDLFPQKLDTNKHSAKCTCLLCFGVGQDETRRLLLVRPRFTFGPSKDPHETANTPCSSCQHLITNPSLHLTLLLEPPVNSKLYFGDLEPSNGLILKTFL